MESLSILSMNWQQNIVPGYKVEDQKDIWWTDKLMVTVYFDSNSEAILLKLSKYRRKQLLM